MLVLTRKIGEQIVIGQNIVVTVSEVRGDRVKLVISAPAEIPVHRKEVFERLRANNGVNSQTQAVHESRLLVACA